MIKTQVDRLLITSILQKVQKITGTVKLESETTGITFIVKKDSFSIMGVSDSRFISIPIKIDSLLFESEQDVVKVATDFRKLQDVISGMRDEKIKIEIQSARLLVLGKNSKFTLPVVEKNLPDDQPDKKNTCIVDPKDLLFILKNTQFSSSSETSRPVLSSIKASALDGQSSIFVTTDGFRLSLIRAMIAFPESQKIQIPINFFRDVSSFVLNQEKKVSVSFTSDDKCVFEQEGLMVWTKMVVGDFPPYEKVLFPEYLISISCSREALLEAVKSMSVMSRDFSNIIVVELKKDKLVIRTKKEVGGENEAVVETAFTFGIEDTPTVVAFNAKYLSDYLSVVTDDMVTFRLNRADSPALFIPGQIENTVPTDSLIFRHIIMPVRISE